jgi:hypothetical protein
MKVMRPEGKPLITIHLKTWEDVEQLCQPEVHLLQAQPQLVRGYLLEVRSRVIGVTDRLNNALTTSLSRSSCTQAIAT